jgi:hypothetical protein
VKAGCVTEIVEEGSRKGRSTGTIDPSRMEFSQTNASSPASNGTSSSASITFLSKSQKESNIGVSYLQGVVKWRDASRYSLLIWETEGSFLILGKVPVQSDLIEHGAQHLRREQVLKEPA